MRLLLLYLGKIQLSVHAQHCTPNIAANRTMTKKFFNANMNNPRIQRSLIFFVDGVTDLTKKCIEKAIVYF